MQGMGKFFMVAQVTGLSLQSNMSTNLIFARTIEALIYIYIWYMT